MTESERTQNTTTGHHETHHGAQHETHSEGDTHGWHAGDEVDTHQHEKEEKQARDKETHMNGKNLKTLAGLILTVLMTFATGTTARAATGIPTGNETASYTGTTDWIGTTNGFTGVSLKATTSFTEQTGWSEQTRSLTTPTSWSEQTRSLTTPTSWSGWTSQMLGVPTES